MKQALLLAFACKQQYHIVRAVAAAGYKVHVIGQHCAEGLKHSRYCSSYHPLQADMLKASLAEIGAEISALSKKCDAEIIFPADVVATRALCALKDTLPIRTCALPSPQTFDILDDKWEFYRLCQQHQLHTPQTWLIENTEKLKEEIDSGRLQLPLIIKPHNAMGNMGIIPLETPDHLSRLTQIDYAPLLVQRFIKGKEIDISIVANKGEIVAYAIQQVTNGHYEFLKEDTLLQLASGMAKHTHMHGIAHIDAIREHSTGNIYLIECNPRVWYSIFATIAAGANFISFAINPETLSNTPRVISDIQVTANGIKPMLRKCLSQRKPPNAVERRMLHYFLADPKGKRTSKRPEYDDTLLPQGAPGSAKYRIAALTHLRVQPTPITPSPPSNTPTANP